MTKQQDGGETLSRRHRPTNEWAHALVRVQRFGQMEMLHRTNGLIHAKRVNSLSLRLAAAAKQAGYGLDIGKIAWMSIHHDDAEVDVTDIPSPVKWAMSAEERQALRSRELKSEAAHAGIFTTLPIDVYLASQKETHEKATTESQIVDIADKLDGLCETLHEIRTGNSEPYLEVLDNYRMVFGGLSAYPVFSMFGIQVPSREEAIGMKRVSTDMLKVGGGEAFWGAVFDEGLPEYYKTWMQITMGDELFKTLKSSIALFPGWEPELREAAEAQKGINSEELLELERLLP